MPHFLTNHEKSKLWQIATLSKQEKIINVFNRANQQIELPRLAQLAQNTDSLISTTSHTCG
ncbi:hypothetical protein ENHAE0001_2354 [Enhydrobacter aerosaccus SK60]|nr:hypothetical protein ENHAE0001_2354 [Enhydrobacter aerosaccus SK60]